MASPAEIAEVLPETLPGDFGEWDNEGSPTQPVRLAGSERGLQVVSKPATEPAESNGAVAVSSELLRGAALPASVPESVEDSVFLHGVLSLSPASDRLHGTVGQKLEAAPAIQEVRFSAPRLNGTAEAVMQKSTPASQNAAIARPDEFQFHSFEAATAEPKPLKKMVPIIVSTSAALVLAAILISVLSQRKTSPVKAAAVQQPTTTVIQQPQNAIFKPSHSTLTFPAQPATAANNAKHGSDAAPASDRRDAGHSYVQAEMMNGQLNTPARIQRAAIAEPAPPPSGGFAAAEMDGSGNPVVGVFNSTKQPTVQVATPDVINVSAPVAFGLLIQKTLPVYPQIARSVHASGTVVLHALISKNGNIEEVRVIDGPELLRQVAIDAVRTWRYSPYKIGGKPTEFATTISVTFSSEY